MTIHTKTMLGSAAGLAFGLLATSVTADTIDPIFYTADLAVGESTTIEKTVVVEATGTTSALIDIHFLFDTSGSMGSEIAAAKTAADEIFTRLDAFGDVAASVGVYSEAARLDIAGRTAGSVPGRVINQDLTTDSTTAIAAINAVTLGDPDGGGDGPENGNTGIELSVENLSWRPASNRFVFVFGDYGFKTPDAADGYGFDFTDASDDVDGDPTSSNTDVIAALTAGGVDLYGLQFAGSSTFTRAIEDLGGTAYPSSDDPDDIADDIIAGIIDSFAEYETVTVDDLGAGLPEIDVSTVCTGADIGACAGADAVGDYDRSVDRTFTFDVTFTRVAGGESSFATHALVYGGIVASEKDHFPDGGTPVIPLPATAWMLLAGIGGLGAMRRRKKS